MSEFKKGQAVKFTNTRGRQKAGKFIDTINLGDGRGKGIYAQVEVDGKTLRVRPNKLVAT